VEHLWRPPWQDARHRAYLSSARAHESAARAHGRRASQLARRGSDPESELRAAELERRAAAETRSMADALFMQLAGASQEEGDMEPRQRDHAEPGPSSGQEGSDEKSAPERADADNVRPTRPPADE
jgi:hypothetical protein